MSIATTSLFPAGEKSGDPRLARFYDPSSPEVFHSVCHEEQIWRSDPFDVHAIHEEARETFYQYLTRSTAAPRKEFGSILCFRGVAGSGKTHLLRAFRTHVHGNHRGYCSYLQMTTQSKDYTRFILNNLIDSLGHPYYDEEGDRSGLSRLAVRIVEKAGILNADEFAAYREDDLDAAALADRTARMADAMIAKPGFGRFEDTDLLRAVCYLPRKDPTIRPRVLKYLRCEELNDFDRVHLPRFSARNPDTDAERILTGLGELMWISGQDSMVFLIDQLEGMDNHDANADGTEQRFRLATQTLCRICDKVPSSLVVIACLDNFYGQYRNFLTQPIRDRIENDPPVLTLRSSRSAEEVAKIIEYRLNHLYGNSGRSDPVFPFTAEFVEKLSGTTARDVLNQCLLARRQGAVTIDPDFPRLDSAGPCSAEAQTGLEQSWHDFRAAFSDAKADSEEEQSELLEWAIEACALELPDPTEIHGDREGRFVKVRGQINGTLPLRLLVAVSNKKTQGNGLMRQVDELCEKLDGETAVIVRSTEYPSNPKTEICRRIGQLVSQGGKRVVIEDWRLLSAFRAFDGANGKHDAYRAWRKKYRPLSSFKPLSDILSLQSLVERAAAEDVENAARTPPQAAAIPSEVVPGGKKKGSLGDEKPPSTLPLALGVTMDVREATVTMQRNELLCHAAFLGGAGSGKTTAALNVVEQALLQGVPAILVDRKGDLAGYATGNWWSGVTDTPELAKRRQLLRNRVAVSVYTPGAPRGRDIAIPLTPRDMAQLPTSEQQDIAKVAADALASMIPLKQTTADKKLLAVLKQTLQFYPAWQREGSITVKALVDLLSEPPPELLSAIHPLEPKACKSLAESLHTLALLRGSLLDCPTAALDIGQLLGVEGRAASGKIALVVISTKFLGDNSTVDFWTSQFLTALDRWVNKHPKAELQALLLLDEADMYLPANRQPATKWPMENLLKRARAAGLGIMLATQSPGDLDYKCRENIRSWFLGRVQQETALRKLRTVFDAKSDMISRLPGQSQGQFVLARDGQPESFRSNRSALNTVVLDEEQILRLARGENRPDG